MTSNSIIYSIWMNLIFYPVKLLYLNGPSFGNYGFWSGKNLSDVCGELTLVKSSFWEANDANRNECIDLIERKVNGICVGVVFALTCYVFFKIFNTFCFRFFVLAPFLNKIDKLDNIINTIHSIYNENELKKVIKKAITAEMVLISDTNCKSFNDENNNNNELLDFSNKKNDKIDKNINKIIY